MHAYILLAIIDMTLKNLWFVANQTALLQNGADPSIRNSEGKTPYDLADPGSTQAVFTGEHMKHQVLEAARSGNEER